MIFNFIIYEIVPYLVPQFDAHTACPPNLRRTFHLSPRLSSFPEHTWQSQIQFFEWWTPFLWACNRYSFAWDQRKGSWEYSCIRMYHLHLGVPEAFRFLGSTFPLTACFSSLAHHPTRCEKTSFPRPPMARFSGGAYILTDFFLLGGSCPLRFPSAPVEH